MLSSGWAGLVHGTLLPILRCGSNRLLIRLGDASGGAVLMVEPLERSGYMIPVDASGIRATGHWVEFEGFLYPAVDLDSEFYLRWFGEVPPGDEWRRQHHSSESAQRPSEYMRIVSATDVTRFVRLDTRALWEGRKFGVMGFDAQENVFLDADVPREVALALVAGRHSWDMFDRSRVWGRVPVSELTDVVETLKDFPLPKV